MANRCAGTYPEFCDAAREYASPLNVLKKARKWSLIKYMEKYWTDNTGDNESLWKHEFDKHGTCMSTLETGCYGKRYVEAVEEIDFYEATIEQFKKLDSYKVYLGSSYISGRLLTRR